MQLEHLQDKQSRGRFAATSGVMLFASAVPGGTVDAVTGTLKYIVERLRAED